MEAVLFDLDGTLLDTVPDIRACLNESLALFSYPPITEEQTKQFVGDGAKKLVERAVPEGGDVEGVYADFKARFREYPPERTKLYRGELECLKKLKAKGYKLGVVTNKPQKAAENVIRRLIPIDFDIIVGDTGDFPCKPDPTVARYASLSLHLFPQDCIFVGDGETDALTAKNADMLGISCLWGYRTKEQLQGAGATNFVSDFAELEKFLLAL